MLDLEEQIRGSADAARMILSLLDYIASKTPEQIERIRRECAAIVRFDERCEKLDTER